MNDSLSIIIVGATGRMGKTLIERIISDEDSELIGAIEQKQSIHLGEDAGKFLGINTGVSINTSFDNLTSADVLIDFTRPEASLAYLEVCKKNKINYVLGTTGFSDDEKELIAGFSKDIAICFAPNMSIGVNVLLSLVESATKLLHDDFDIEIIESHHKHKIDAPSGTALKLGESVAKNSGRSLKVNGVFSREGILNPRGKKDIGFSTIRGGDIVGDHTVLYAGDGERIELTHKAASRDTFAKGALTAAKFLNGKTNGLFDMKDVLGLI